MDRRSTRSTSFGWDVHALCRRHRGILQIPDFGNVEPARLMLNQHPDSSASEPVHCPACDASGTQVNTTLGCREAMQDEQRQMEVATSVQSIGGAYLGFGTGRGDGGGAVARLPDYFCKPAGILLHSNRRAGTWSHRGDCTTIHALPRIHKRVIADHRSGFRRDPVAVVSQCGIARRVAHRRAVRGR